MLELGDPIGAAMGRYLAASMGDMAGRDDVLGDITAARELATVTKDVSLLCQLLRLEARVVQRSDDERGRAVLAEAAEQLEACGGIRAAALARRDLGLLALARGDLDDAAAQLLTAVSVLRASRPVGGRAAPLRRGLAQLAVERATATVAARIAALVPAMRRPGAPSSARRRTRARRARRRHRPGPTAGAAPRRSGRSTTKASWTCARPRPGGSTEAGSGRRPVPGRFQHLPTSR